MGRCRVDEIHSGEPQTFPPMPPESPESMDLLVTNPEAPTVPMQGWIDVAPELQATAPATWYQPPRRFISRRVVLPVWALLLVIPCLLAALAFGLVLGARGGPGFAHAPGAGGSDGTGGSGALTQHVTGGQTPQWATLQSFSGNGNANTTPFTITSSAWNVVWTCDPRSEGNGYHLDVDAVHPAATDGPTVVNMQCDPGDPTTWRGQTAEYATGTFYLSVASDGPWTLTVQVPG